MRISALKTVCVELPIEKPVATAIHDIRSIGAVLVFLETDEGATGESYLFSLSGKRLKILDAMVESLRPLIIGANPCDPEAIWEAIWRDINFFGHKGIAVFGLSAIDTACWDAAGKAAGRPLLDRLGAVRDRVPVYASGGLWLNSEAEALAEEAMDFVATGFRAVKLRIGRPAIDEDVARVAAVREAIGPDIALMVDANQGLSHKHAIELGHRIAAFDLTWFEEPVPVYDRAGNHAVGAALEMPLAGGETEYTRYGFRDLIEAKTAHVMMPDLQRVGGVTEMLRVAQLCAANDLPVSPHLFTEHCLQLLGSLPNGTYLEHMPWFAPLFNETLTVEDGTIEVPRRPGLGFTFDRNAIERYRIEVS